MTPKEYNHCVELYADRVYRFMLKNTREAAEAEDMVQNAFEVLWRNHEKVEVDKARSYLFSVSHHQMIDSLRKNKRMSYTEELPKELLVRLPLPTRPTYHQHLTTPLNS